MGESYRGEYSATDWADDFLTEAIEHLPKDTNLPEFRRALEFNKIQKNNQKYNQKDIIKKINNLKVTNRL